MMKMNQKMNLKIKLEDVVLDWTGCFGIGVLKENTIDLKKFEKTTWRNFRSWNKRKKNRGEWFYDDWLIEKVRDFIHLLGYRLKDLRVYKPKKRFPLIISFEAYRNIGYIMIAPRLYP